MVSVKLVNFGPHGLGGGGGAPCITVLSRELDPASHGTKFTCGCGVCRFMRVPLCLLVVGSFVRLCV